MSNDNALLRSKGRIWVFDEKSAQKKMREVSLVDNVKISHPANAVQIKSPSGITILDTLDLGASLSFDLYNPGDNSILELLYRGAVSLTEYDGTTLQSETVWIKFRAAGESFPLPGFNGAKTAATVANVKRASNLSTTYTVSTDYTVTVDAETGITLVNHVSGGTIPLNEDIQVVYSFTPLASRVLKPNYGGALTYRSMVVDAFSDCADLTKYRRYFLPEGAITSELTHSLLAVGDNNNSPNILPVTFELTKPDACSKKPTWYWIDTIVHS